MFEQGLPQDDFESPPLEALQTISEMCRELRPGNATILYHGADVQTIVRRVRAALERVQLKSFQGVQESGRFGEHLIDMGCPPQV